MKKVFKVVLRGLSKGQIKVQVSRRLADLKRLDPTRIFVRKLDEKIYNGDYEIPVRLYFPSEEAMEEGVKKEHEYPILLFFHGGGWVTESVSNYDRVCSEMSQSSGHIVVSVEYRLAPEYRFPTALMDCYEAAKAVYANKFILNVRTDKITIIGDSAGGNLAAAVTLMARDRKEFYPKRQILIYPVLNNDYTETSAYSSVKENGTDYFLTSAKMEDYLNLYQRDESDRKNKYFAPMLEKELDHLPDTLILTAEFDPLRDEGEHFARRLKEAGNNVEVHRIKGALHGYFALGFKHLYVRESFEFINHFLEEA